MGEVNYAPLIDDMVWSYSRIKAFEDCHYRWYLKYIKKFHGKDIAEMLDGLIELQEPTPSILDIITGAAGIASIIASVCLIAKTIKRK